MTKARPTCKIHGCHNIRKRRKIKNRWKYDDHCDKHYREKYGIKRTRSKHKKDHCENIYDLLGFVCTTTIIDDSMLSIDHWDGNRNNNDPSNLITLCACCHNYKTKLFGDNFSKKHRRKLQNVK